MELLELEHDTSLHQKLSTFKLSIDKIESTLEHALDENLRDSLSLKDRLNHDLFTAYMLNTLYWCYLRTKGIDPNANKVKEELARVREYMIKARQAIERHTIRPSVNQKVAERFIKHGVQKMESGGGKRKHSSGTGNDGGPPASKPRNKHTRFPD